MAFTTMHFAVGMSGTAAVSCAGALLLGRGWRWIPLTMALGGVLACVPDMPRLFRQDFPSLGLASTLGSKELEDTLHAHGDWFFFHHALDAQPREFALHGLVIILLLYSISSFLLAITHRRPQHQPTQTDAKDGPQKLAEDKPEGHKAA